MGDPETPLYTANPASFTNVIISGNGLTITVTTGVDGCKIAVTSGKYGANYYNVADGVNTYTFEDVPKNYSIVISKHNYVPYVYESSLYIQNEEISANRSYNAKDVFIGRNVTTDKPEGNVIIEADAQVIINTQGTTIIKNGFKVENGATFEINTEH